MSRHHNRKWDNIITYTEDGKVKIHSDYNQWSAMRKRCFLEGRDGYDKKYYGDCYCSESFKNFDKYLEWAKKQVGFLCRDEKGKLWQLDKDFLFKGNKLYSEDTCVFIPQRLNKFITLRQRNRGDFPLGVVYNPQMREGNRYQVSGCFKELGLPKRLGSFPTPEIAFETYKLAKEKLAKQLANQYKGTVDERVIDMLNSFTISIYD